MDDELLRITLAMAVPLAIEDMRQKPGILRALRGQTDELSRACATFGDAVLFGNRDTRPAFNVLVQAVAMLAFDPDGVTVAGLHFQAKEAR